MSSATSTSVAATSVAATSVAATSVAVVSSRGSSFSRRRQRQFRRRRLSGHVVVDGSSFACVGDGWSVSRLFSGAAAVRKENPFAVVTVVVDAGLKHRVSGRDAVVLQAAFLRGNVVVPPAGTAGGVGAFIEAVCVAGLRNGKRPKVVSAGRPVEGVENVLASWRDSSWVFSARQ